MKYTAVIIFLCFSTALWSQKGYELGGWLGMAHYFGDLNTSYALQDPGPAGGGIARYNFNERIDLKFGLNAGLIRGQDEDSSNPFERARNLSFRNLILDAALQLEFNFFPYVHGSDDMYYTPYIFAGGAFLYHNPKAKYEGDWVGLRELGTEGQRSGDEYSLFQGGLVYGLGFKFDISDLWSINIEWSGRKPFTDYIDDVSGVYPDRAELQGRRGDLAVALYDRSPEVVDLPIGQEGRQRGNGRNDDSYHFFSVGLVYYIGPVQCPDISKPRERTPK
jgi:hypothetical protein